MKYKVGDKVRIRTWKSMEKKYGLDCHGDISPCNGYFYFDNSLKHLCGSIVEITHRGQNGYSINNHVHYFLDRMIEGLAKEEFKEGEEVLARDGEDCKRKKVIFLCKIPGNIMYPCCCVYEPDSDRYRRGENISVSRYEYIKKLPKTIVKEFTQEQRDKIKEALDLD